MRCARRAGASLPWAVAALTTYYYLDILAKEAGMEAEPVGGDVEPALEKEVPLEGAGAHWEVTGDCREQGQPGSPRSRVLPLRSPDSSLGDCPPQSPSQSQAPATHSSSTLASFPATPDRSRPTRLLDVSSSSIHAPKGPACFRPGPLSLDVHLHRQNSLPCPARERGP